MNSPLRCALGMALAFTLINVASAQTTANDEALQLARTLTDEGSKTFNTAKASAMSAYYTEDAKVFLQTSGENGVSIKEYSGREEIEGLYAEHFKNATGTIRSKNTVEYARKLNSRTLAIAGTFIPDEGAAEPLSIPFYQVRIKHDDRWLIHSLRIYYLPEKP